MTAPARKRLILLYHFFHPDDVISARLFAELGEEAAKRGWDVVAMPAVRSCHDGAARLAKHETWRGISIWRVWRPGWRQSSNKGRLGNTAFMLLGWTLRALWTSRSRHETMILGTDPPLGVLAAIPWRLFRPRARIVHWCHDLYPQAAVADGVLKADSMLVRGLNALLRVAYARCDCIADLGPCMRDRLLKACAMEEKKGDENESGQERGRSYGVTALRELTPWSLVEPERVPEADEAVRQDLFGTARLGLLYSGNLGRAHIYEPFLALARRLAGDSVAFCFAGRGPLRERLEVQLREAKEEASGSGSGASELAGVRLAAFAPEEVLQKRLAAADVHMVSLHPDWTGTVVPSKFFGALAVGRPVLFAGRSDSAIARWIRQHNVGWVLDSDASIELVAQQLRAIAADRAQLAELQQRCFDVYHQHFSKQRQMLKWWEVLS
jgi:colanic acid biosynthesis glycosyl transferase WcaI